MTQQVDTALLKKAIPGFRKFLEAEGTKWREERDRKVAFFKEHFSNESVGQLDEGILRELIHILWAFNSWTNKDWLLQQMLTSGLPTIRKAFDQLIHGAAPLADRFDRVRKEVRMMGAAGISEVLAHIDHEQYGIWNRRSREGLIRLGVEAGQLPKSAQITGKRYTAFCEVVRDVQGQVAEMHPEIKDLFELDLLLYHISTGAPGTDLPSPPRDDDEDFDHDAVIDQVLELGDGLGFEVAKEFSVMQGCRIDAVWRSRIANLGTISYAFEIHRKGSRDSAILNLQRVRRDPTVQKVVLVSTKKELDAFRGEIASLDEGFRDAVGFFEVTDLQRAVDDLDSLKDTLSALDLLGGEHLLG